MPLYFRKLLWQKITGEHEDGLSEQILQITEVIAKGSSVFENRDQFLAWMNHPNKALNDKTPMSLLNSKLGSDMVLDELGRIEPGVFS